MKNKILKKSGFTLAEVLVAIAIIGSVFLISVNTLNVPTKDRENSTQLMKFYPIFDNLINLVALENMGIENIPFGIKDEVGNDEFVKLLIPRLRVGEDCQNSVISNEKGCWTDENFNGKNFNTDSSFYKFRLVDGMSIAIKSFKNCEGIESFDNKNYDFVCAVIYVDVNSHEPPNKWNEDVFAFVYNKDIKKSDYNNAELIEHTPAILRPASKKAIEIIEKPKETRKH
ncbi:prepilin-type N-terminal cleavage/methylation domain-containing protein [bacterium]|nr:prepilin-type N-terminal cleavage/methylation domain-containing protein [bacterium]